MFRPVTWWRWAVVIALGTGALAVPPAAVAGVASVEEHPLKAAFTYNFLKFTSWPAGRFADAEAPVIIGVLGRSPMLATIETLVANRQINGRAILVRRVGNAEEARAAHLLFCPAAEDRRSGELLAVLAGEGVLTVGESDEFARRGGMINFVLEQDKVRFEINVSRVEQGGLKLSAQLQKLASAVRRDP
jgi:hypothetical protein